MQYVKVSAAILLLVSSAIRAMEENDQEISPLTNLENQIAGYEQDPQVKLLAEYFKKTRSDIALSSKALIAFDAHRSATLIVNALLVAFKAKEYPIDKDQGVTNNAPRPTERLTRLTLYALDNICTVWNQAHNKNELAESDEIPLSQLEKDYSLAINRLECQIRAKGSIHVATQIQTHLRELTKNK